jgi:UDP-glucose 4-epimerase
VRVLVTGGTGYVGAHFVQALGEAGHAVTILARDPRRVPSLASIAGVTLVRGDVCDAGAVREASAGHDALVHNALVWGDEAAERDLADPRATSSVLTIAAASGVKHLVYTSSTAVHRPFRAFMSVDDALRPTDLYGVSKATGELALWAIAHEHDIAATVIRAAPVVGPPAAHDAPFKSDARFEKLVTEARAGRDLVVARNDGRQFIGAGDLARVYVAALASDGGRALVLAVATDFVTWEEIAAEIVRRVGSGRVVVEDTGLASRAFTFDAAPLERAYGLSFTAREAVMAHVAHLTR